MAVSLPTVPPSPCGRCTAACCKQNGHAFAVLLQTEAEVRRFTPWATDVPIDPRETGRPAEFATVIPYRDGRCPFLGEDNRCTIYEDRPLSCREFECTRYFNQLGLGRHGRFLELNPRVLKLLSECENGR